jgi:GntR family transcriptional regulator
MIVSVDPRGPTPPYEQIRSQVASMISTGTLPAGSRLPTIRQLAADLGLAPGTVARAYRELEGNGVIETRGRHGTFALAPRATSVESRARLLGEAARAFAVAATQVGADHAEALAAADRALEDILGEAASA